MTTTLREILRQFEDNGDLDNEYVTIEEYADSVAELVAEKVRLKAILQQWAEASPGLVLLISAQLEPEQLKEFIGLIAATKTALGE